MKKRNLTSLTLQKSTISNLNKESRTVVGGASGSLCPDSNPDYFTCLCTLECSLLVPGICLPDVTEAATCPTTCSPESCYAC